MTKPQWNHVKSLFGIFESCLIPIFHGKSPFFHGKSPFSMVNLMKSPCEGTFDTAEGHGERLHQAGDGDPFTEA